MTRKTDFLCERSVSFRAVDDGEASDGRTLYGYAAVFGADTEINSWEGTFIERFDKGSFKKTIRERLPKIQFDHGHDTRTGTVPIGAYQKIEEHDEGLYVEARLFDNDLVEPIRQAVEGGAIDGMSIKFRVVRDEWRDNAGKKVKAGELYDLLWDPGDRGPLVRTIKEVALMEAGPVVFPAYAQTSVGVRSEADSPFEGLSDEERKAAVVEAYKSRMPEDDELPDEKPEAVREDTSDDVEEPEDAASERSTSTGHTEPDKAPVKRVVPKPLPDADSRKESVPMTLEELRARHAEIVARCTEIDTEYRDAELPAEAQTEWDGLDTERGKVEASIKRIEARKAALIERSDDETVTRSGDKRKAPAVHIKKDEADLHDLEALRKESFGSDDFVERAKDAALRIAEKLPVPRFLNAERSRENVMDLLENYDTTDGELAKRMVVTSSKLYERAFGKLLVSQNPMLMNPDEQRALAVGANATGGFAVPAQLDPTIVLTDSLGISPIRQLARVEQIVGNKWQGITSAGVTVSRDAEAEEVSDDSPTLAQPEVQPTRVQGFVPFSYEIDQDWGGLRGEVTRMLARAKTKEENVSFLTGDGLGNNPQGVLTGATVTVATAGAFSAAHPYALDNALPAEFREGAAFLANKTIYNTIRQFAVTDGHSLWQRIGDGQPDRLLGYPDYEATGMATDPSVLGAKLMILGNFEEGFIIVDRIGMSIELIPHLFGANRRPTGQRGIYAIWRNGSKVLNPNAFRVLVKS